MHTLLGHNIEDKEHTKISYVINMFIAENSMDDIWAMKQIMRLKLNLKDLECVEAILRMDITQDRKSLSTSKRVNHQCMQ